MSPSEKKRIVVVAWLTDRAPYEPGIGNTPRMCTKPVA